MGKFELELRVGELLNTTEGTATSNKPISEKLVAGVKACAPAGSVPLVAPRFTFWLNGMFGGG